MSGAACKGAECTTNWNPNQSEREMHARKVGNHPEFVAAAAADWNSGSAHRMNRYRNWIKAFSTSPMSDAALDVVEAIIAEYTQVPGL